MVRKCFDWSARVDSTGKISDFPFWDNIGNKTRFWEIIVFFFPFLGICWKAMGKIISQKWENFGKLKWNTNLITSLGNNCGVSQKLGNCWKALRQIKSQKWEIIGE